MSIRAMTAWKASQPVKAGRDCRRHGASRPACGGMHIYYRRPEGVELRTPIIAENIVKAGGTPPFGPGIDVSGLRDRAAVPAHLRPALRMGRPSVRLCRWPRRRHWIVERLTKAERHARQRNRHGARRMGQAYRWRNHRVSRPARGAGRRQVGAGPYRSIRHLPPGSSTPGTLPICRPPIPEHEERQIFARIVRAEAKRLRHAAGETAG